MLLTICERLRSVREREDGFTVIEVLIAMMVFAVMSVGLAAGITNSLTLTRDSRAREVASTLAMNDIEQLRTLDNVLQIKSLTTPVTQQVGNLTFTLKRTVKLATSDGTANPCGTGSGSVSFKNIQETVTWATSSTTSKQQSLTMTTAVAPSSNINSDTTGSIFIGVQNAAGGAVVGITPTITGPSTVTVPATDSEGCTYALGVAPGTYTISLNKTGWVDSTQANPSQQQVTISAGGSGHAAFSYDTAVTANFAYAKNWTGGTPSLPTNMTTTLVNQVSGATPLLNTPSSAPVFPFTGGYRAVAGSFATNSSGGSATCLAPDPAQWTTPNSTGAIGVATPYVDPTTATIAVPMGAVTVNALSSGTYLTAVSSATLGSGDPGCANGMTLTFPKATGSTQTIALPFGTWTLYRGTTSGAKTLVIIATDPLTVHLQTQGTAAGTVTLDPRGVTW